MIFVWCMAFFGMGFLLGKISEWARKLEEDDE